MDTTRNHKGDFTVDGLNSWCERALELGAEGAAPLAPSLVVTAEWVRLKCRFGCDGYGQCRTCPPDSPTPEQTRRLLDEYSRAILLRHGPHAVYENHDEHSAALRRATADLERELFLAGHHKALAIANGPCDLCETCDRDGPCVDPAHARPSMEACGIDVFATVRAAGWEIEVVRDRDDEYRFFALVLVD
jgi:predicted metal-binding protein